MTLTDFEVIMDISLDEAVACFLDECESEAEWRVVLSCCKRDFNLCNQHYKNGIEFLNSNKTMQCGYCGKKMRSAEWIGRVHPI